MFNNPSPFDRRRFLATAGAGFGAIALSAMQPTGFSSAAYAETQNRSWFDPARAKAKRIIWLFMHGGPSHVDLFDPKPELDRNHGKSILKEARTHIKSN